MRINMIARLLTLALVLLMTLSVPAKAETCALCGQESGSDAYLCAACLLSLLDEEDISGGMMIVGTSPNEDGSVTLVWSDEANNGPYNVYYELLEQVPVPFGWTAATDVYGNAFTLNQLVPGVSYVFTVEDASGNKAASIYYAPDVDLGNEIGAKIRINTKMRNGRNHLDIPFYVGDLLRPITREHGITLKLSYSMLKYTRYYAFTITVEAPNGFVDVVYSGDLTLNFGRSEVAAWNFIALDDYFGYLESYYGGIPTGEYLVTMNFNGQPACTDTFTVEQ